MPETILETADTLCGTRSLSSYFDDSDMPLPHIWEPLFDIFLRQMSQHFPSISKRRMIERVESATMSRFLANTICSVAARYLEDKANCPIKACSPFIAKAEESILSLVHLPTTETLTALLLLAWSYHGQNSASGLWQYLGMAIRMAVDIGIHQVSELYDSPAHLIRTRLLWWTLFVNDRVAAFDTGRPSTIREDIIEIPLPQDEDFFPDPARNLSDDKLEMVEPVPFVYFTRLMVICGGISDLLNGRWGCARTLIESAEPVAANFGDLLVKMTNFLSRLPPSMQWSGLNLKHHNDRGHGVSNR